MRRMKIHSRYFQKQYLIVHTNGANQISSCYVVVTISYPVISKGPLNSIETVFKSPFALCGRKFLHL
ncbi:hypothetical protein JHK82_040511 [Glycine max]|nr:hypothetical protein JHK87_040532 [Glycine soja]KAG4963834.1 hypothetical protein JHK86_040702 [Glycine max]KAG5111288.1 hypothetical protein JHK82_040511 [Glycine max]KAG5122574.1 hypothetical protein JHK84_040914 [Glycine max]